MTRQFLKMAATVLMALAIGSMSLSAAVSFGPLPPPPLTDIENLNFGPLPPPPLTDIDNLNFGPLPPPPLTDIDN